MTMEILMKKQKKWKCGWDYLKSWVGIFYVGIFYLGRNFPGGNLPAGSLIGGTFLGGSSPDTTLNVWVQTKILLLLVICYFYYFLISFKIYLMKTTFPAKKSISFRSI